MCLYLSGVVDDLANQPIIICVDLHQILQASGPESLATSLQARRWYRHAMDMEQVIMHADYAPISSNSPADYTN